MYTIFAADIGATNCRFALFRANVDDAGQPMLSLLREKWLAGADYPEFRQALRTLRDPADNGPFLPEEPGQRPAIAVLALAGPVEGDSCRLSNLSWEVRAHDVREETGVADVRLINDFAAQAYACLMPENVDAAPVLPGEAVPGAPVAVAGAGTGFGQALILPDACFLSVAAQQHLDSAAHGRTLLCLAKARILPAEGGHCDFPFAGKEEQEFADFVRKSTGIRRIIGDTIVSGSGLVHIVAFLTGERLPPREATARALALPQALEWYARFYGRACRNYVLATLALGGLYITGGMALRVPALSHPAFAEEFHNSLAQERLLRNIPVFHVRKPEAGLWGAALYGLLRAEEDK